MAYSLLTDLQRLLEAHGLPIRQAGKLGGTAKIAALMGYIDHGSPIILSIGNGHLRRGRYFLWARLPLGHYITVYANGVSTSTPHICEGTLPIRFRPVTKPEPMPNVRDWKGPHL